jgi:WhiB family redox-sensing transcriptional regulator
MQEGIVRVFPSLDDRDTRWMDEAACRGYPLDTFYPNLPQTPSKAEQIRYQDDVARATRICAGCPVRAECLKDATDRHEIHGVWGGKDFHVPGIRGSRRLTMLKRILAVLLAAAGIYLILSAAAGGAHASITGIPVGASVIGLGVTSDTCLSVQHDSLKPGTPVAVIDCHPGWPREQWDFHGQASNINRGTITPWGSSLSLGVTPAGKLILAAGPGKVWTYGPGHALTFPVKAGREWLTWLPGHGRQPWVTGQRGPGQVVYIFKFLGA